MTRACSLALITLEKTSRTPADAQRARDAYLEIFDRIAQRKAERQRILQTTQLGLDLSVGVLRRPGAVDRRSAPRMKASCAWIWKVRTTHSAPWNW